MAIDLFSLIEAGDAPTDLYHIIYGDKSACDCDEYLTDVYDESGTDLYILSNENSVIKL